MSLFHSQANPSSSGFDPVQDPEALHPNLSSNLQLQASGTP